MANELQTKPVREQSAAPQEQVRVQPLQEILARVGRDSREQSGQYLDETIVPHGGE